MIDSQASMVPTRCEEARPSATRRHHEADCRHPRHARTGRENEVPICGKDFKTGQTLMKTVLAPAFKARLLGLSGWYSTNILGNRDGEVLDDPGSFKTKEESKLGALEHISQPQLYPSCTATFSTRFA